MLNPRCVVPHLSAENTALEQNINVVSGVCRGSQLVELCCGNESRAAVGTYCFVLRPETRLAVIIEAIRRSLARGVSVVSRVF